MRYDISVQKIGIGMSASYLVISVLFAFLETSRSKSRLKRSLKFSSKGLLVGKYNLKSFKTENF